jgi:hypothetical protein
MMKSLLPPACAIYKVIIASKLDYIVPCTVCVCVEEKGHKQDDDQPHQDQLNVETQLQLCSQLFQNVMLVYIRVSVVLI